jgi:hypothetical protein
MTIWRREPEEVRVPGQLRGTAGVDLVDVDHHAGLLRLPEDPGQPHHRDGARADQVPRHLACADRGELVYVPDEQQVRARRPPVST